jgi:transcriptional activator protein UGA3
VTIHPLFGISTCLYEYLASANQLAARIAHGSSPSTPDEWGAEAQDIELALQSWNPPDNDNPSRLMAEAQAAAFAMQWATMIRLLQTTRKLKNDNPRIKKAAENILSALSLIRPGSELEVHILFPLFMAGVCSMTKPTRMTVEFRFNILETTIGFGNIKLAHQLLDEIWRRANEGDIVDWEVLMRTKYPGLVLL